MKFGINIELCNGLLGFYGPEIFNSTWESLIYTSYTINILFIKIAITYTKPYIQQSNEEKS